MTGPGGRLLLRSRGADDTRELAAAVTTLLRPGDVVSLTGELGAGKTCFVQGAARALGVEERVTSPTFMLVKRYDAAVPIVHVDVYRLDRLQEVLDLGEDVFGPDELTFVEWGDTIAALLPPDRLEIEVLLADDDGDGPDADRWLRAEGHGGWGVRMAALARACEAWVVDGAEAG